MENELSEGALQALQNGPVKNLPRDHSNKLAKDKYEINSRLTQNLMVKNRKKHSTQDTIPHPQATNGPDSTTFLGSMNGSRYPARKRSFLKRFKECSFSPCSEEYKSVLQQFIEADEQEVKSIVAEPRRTRNRKISLIEPRRVSKYRCKKPSSDFETELPRFFNTRTRCNTLPSRVSVVTTPKFQPVGKTKETGKDVLDDIIPLRSHVKLAWQLNDADFGSSVKKEKGRHVSLSEAPPRLNFSKSQKEKGRKLSETSPPRELLSYKDKNQKERQRKQAEIDLPNIVEKLFIDDSQLKAGDSESISDETWRKIYTADQMHVGHDLKDFSKKDLPQGAKWLNRERSFSDKKLKTPPTVKIKLSHSLSSPTGTDHSKTSELTLAPLLDLRNNNFQFETVSEKSPTIRRTDQFSITRANIRRVGQATLAATRLLKTHYRENGGSAKDVAMTED